MFMLNRARHLFAPLFVAASLAFFTSAQAQTWQRLEAVQPHLGNAVQTEGLELGLPLVAENGASVPLTVSFTGQLPPSVHIAELHIFAANNPTPEVASFELGAEAMPLAIETRLRLSESQPVIVVARSSDDTVYVAEQEVRVTTSGCVAPAGSSATDEEMQTRVRVPQRVREGESAEILTRILHPMHTGLADAPDGSTPEQRIIDRFDVTVDGRSILQATYHRSLAANPYLRFQFTPSAGGDVVMTWAEDTGRTVQETSRLELG